MKDYGQRGACLYDTQIMQAELASGKSLEKRF